MIRMKTSTRIVLSGVAAAFFYLTAFAQTPGKTGFRFASEGGEPGQRLLSNSIVDMVPYGSDVLMGTGNGLSVWHIQDQDWDSFSADFGMGEGSVSALDAKDGVIWAATAYTASTSQGPLPAGGGVGFSTDDGYTWTWFDQPVDSADQSKDPDSLLIDKPTTTNVQNVTYDLQVTSTEVWITSWGGGLRKYSFADSTWHIVTPDEQKFSSLDHLNHRAFAVTGDDSVLWVGTAAGINKSTDGGETWENFNHSENGISGNFVTALGRQQWGSYDILWAATWQAEASGEFYGVSKTENGGITWEVVLTDPDQTLKAHNFAFDDSIVYVATNLGLYKSVDLGESWEIFPQIADSASGDLLYGSEVYSALAYENLLFVGTADGIALSPDLGNNWYFYMGLRAYLHTNQNGQPATYAYPNPFSPRLHDVIRFQYDLPSAGRVTVKIFDFAMDEVATVVQNKYRNAGDNYEAWTGLRGNGEPVATGVYFYSVERSSADPVWGKFAVIH